MTTDERTARMNEIVLSDSDTAYILADSSKFDKSSFISYATGFGALLEDVLLELGIVINDIEDDY